MSAVEIDNNFPCPVCPYPSTMSEPCYVCDGMRVRGSAPCDTCSGTGVIRQCPVCGADYWKARRLAGHKPIHITLPGVNLFWALESKQKWPSRPGQWFWTKDGDYTDDVQKALHFKSPGEADRWLRVHAHLRSALCVVSVVAKEPTQ